LTYRLAHDDSTHCVAADALTYRLAHNDSTHRVAADG
jgi:hypothetical protein